MVASVTETSFQVVRILDPKEVEAYRTDPQDNDFNQILRRNIKRYIKGKSEHE